MHQEKVEIGQDAWQLVMYWAHVAIKGCSFCRQAPGSEKMPHPEGLLESDV